MHLMKHDGYHDNVSPASFPHPHLQHHAYLATADHHLTQPQVPAYNQHPMAHFPAHHHDNKGLAGLQHPQYQYHPPQHDVQVSRVQLPTATDPRTQVTCLNDVKNHPVYVTSSSLMTSSQQQPISVAETSKALLIDQSAPQASQEVRQQPGPMYQFPVLERQPGQL